jgi:hypothetical protein
MSLASLTPYSGDITLTTPNQTISGLQISGRIINKTYGCVIQSCYIMGNASGTYSTDTALVDCNSSTSGTLVVQDCLLQPQAYSYYLDGIIGHDYTIQRCEILNTCDGCGGYSTFSQNSNCYIYANYIHDLSGFLNDPEQKNNGVAPGPSHNDCCQMQGNSNWAIVGNTMYGYVSQTVADGPNWNTGTSNSATGGGRQFGPNFQCNSAIQTNENSAVGYAILSGVTISNNWAYGGQETFNISAGNTNASGVIDAITNNQFGRDQGLQGAGGDNTHALEWNSAYLTVTNSTGNVYEDNGDPVHLFTSG